MFIAYVRSCCSELHHIVLDIFEIIIIKKLTNVKQLIFYVLDYSVDNSCCDQDVVRWFVFVNEPINIKGMVAVVVAVAVVNVALQTGI